MRYITSSEPCGEIRLKGSKSHVQRILAMAMFNRGRTVIYNAARCEDVNVAADVLTRSGRRVVWTRDTIIVEPGMFHTAEVYDFRSSALSMRMFIPLIAAYGKGFAVKGRPGLMARNRGWFKEELHRAGIEYRNRDGNGGEVLPVKYASRITLQGGKSSQLVTGLIMAGACGGKPSTVVSEHNISRQYIDLTLRTVEEFGAAAERRRGNEYKIVHPVKEGDYEVTASEDWSNGAYWLIWGVCSGDVKVYCCDKTGIDAGIIDIIRKAGGTVKEGAGYVRASRSPLKAFNCSCVHNPDIIPPLAVLASYISGESRITGTERLRIKESDREAHLFKDLRRLGVDIQLGDGGFVINGGNIRGGKMLSARGDHRLAMSYALAGLISEKGVLLSGDRAVKKSYEGFFRDLKILKGGCR